MVFFFLHVKQVANPGLYEHVHTYPGFGRTCMCFLLFDQLRTCPYGPGFVPIVYHVKQK
jgi:hypothetical protein